MPLLQGKFDPLKFNSTTLAAVAYEVWARAMERQNNPELVMAPWGELDEGLSQECVDQAQAVIERLVADGVIS